MEAPKFTGQNPETHKILLHMMMFIFISNFVIFIFKKIVVVLVLGRPVFLHYLTQFKKPRDLLFFI